MKPSRTLPYVLFFASLLLNACVTSQSGKISLESQKPKYEEFVKSGEALPIESVITIDGEKVDLANPEKKKLVVLFATWCSDSNRALKALNQSAILNDDSIELVAIAREEKEEVVKAWRDKNGIKVPLAADPDRSIYKKFAAAGIPRLITVAKDGKIIKMNLAEGENQLKLIQW
ncbi:TlpA disulfide reductase family protein [Aliikangiella sp. G2MR2-5]|uniref:TlpA family protein disulfide reductase n=1 Tax=Aliikangiella sp. G2MR2-5 TaxID=2788943 RepID=UPI0018AA7B9F|nr:TlpA disulfide reductase family protein [Aliikangiella sp. G2MR2-5]